MRVGKNEQKTAPDLAGFTRHRVVMPVYIPELTGYYEQTLEILRLCLESLRLTTHGRASVTIVSNGSTPEVVGYLKREFDEGWIDQLIINKCNWGRVDAIASGARGTFEELVTVSDCDVIFRAGWLEAVEAVFKDFPECGFASPVPSPASIWYHTSATLLGGMARGVLGFEKVVPEEDLNLIAHTIRKDMFKPEHRCAQMVVKRDGATACVGCGHFVCTIRREIVELMPKRPARRGLRGKASETWLDVPLNESGLWRLATTSAYAHHMGNIPEPWMYEELERCRVSVRADGGTDTGVTSAAEGEPRRREVPAAQRVWTSRLPTPFRQLIVRAIRKPIIQNALFRRLGYPAGYTFGPPVTYASTRNGMT